MDNGKRRKVEEGQSGRSPPAPFFDRNKIAARRALLLHASMAVLLCQPAFAHDYWIERSADTYTLYQGHAYSAHKGEERVPYPPAIVRSAACAKDPGGVVALKLGAEYPVRVAGPCHAVLMDVASGYWTQTLTETVQKPKSEVRGALRGWRSEEAVKRIDAWSPGLAKPLSKRLELVPTENPLTLKPGDKLTLLVSWRGEPKAGVPVAYAGDVRGVTDRDGRINIRIRQAGVQVLAASFDEPVQDANADKLVHGTILQFELKK